MTKEEISKVLELALEYYKLEIFGTSKESQPPTQERIDYIYDHMQSSLPANLEEVAQKAEDYYDVGEEHGYLHCLRGDIKNAFKAGAKWMAGQGASFKANVEDVPQGHWYAGLHLGSCAEEEENALKSINAKDGEEVIVQIRKKQ